MVEPTWLRIATVSGVTSDKWTTLDGRLDLTHCSDQILLLEAHVYFEGPPAGVNVLCAAASLKDEDPSTAGKT